MIKKLTDRLVEKPQMLFLTDSLGALITAIMLFFVLGNFQEYIGMPPSILHILSAIAACFCIYSAACFFFLKAKWPGFIKAICYANLSYCVLTMILMITYYSQLTLLGLAYFAGEIVVICSLVYVELKVAQVLEK